MNPAIEELKKSIDRWTKDADRARQRALEAAAEAERLQAELLSLQHALAALERPRGKPAKVMHQPTLVPDIRTHKTGRNKTDIALTIIANTGAQGINSDQLLDALSKQGLTMSKNYVFNIVSRLKSQNKIEVRGGRYYARTAA
jgi:hypothetical protein